MHELNRFTSWIIIVDELLDSGEFKGSIVWRRKQVLEVQWVLKQLLLEELRGTKSGVGWGGVGWPGQWGRTRTRSAMG